MFFSFSLLRSFLNVTGFLDPFLDCEEFVLQHVKSSRLLSFTKRLLSMKACSTYEYWKTFLKKLEKYLTRGLFYESCEMKYRS